jgi:hypothetical protein
VNEGQNNKKKREIKFDQGNDSPAPIDSSQTKAPNSRNYPPVFA